MVVLCQEGARAPCFVWLNAALLAAAAFAALRVPQLLPAEDAARPAMVKGGVGALLRLPLYRRVVLVAALILGLRKLPIAGGPMRRLLEREPRPRDRGSVV